MSLSLVIKWSWGTALALAIGLSASNVRAAFNPANPIPEEIPHGPARVDLDLVASGLVAPNLLISATDGTDRQFIVDQPGKVWIVENGSLLPTPFLDVSASLVTLSPNFDERGLLGLAFDPGFSDPGSAGYRRLFTYTSQPATAPADLADQYATAIDHHSVVASWRVDALNPNVVDTSTRTEILRIEQPQSNHNGGMLAFGPDQNLYIGLGDGGGANDSGQGHNTATGNGQDPAIALGKMLRIDPNGTNSANGKYGIPADNPFAGGGGVAEIYALGLRNPYRFSFDGSDLLVGDVGQGSIEELNRVQLGGNYGWGLKEGTFKFNRATGAISDDLSGLPPSLIDPIAQYDHDEGISIIGGFVYHGALLPELEGKYVFGDFSKRLLYADLTSGEIREFVIGEADVPLGFFVKGLGEDQNGEIYVLGSTELGPTGTTGVVFQLVPEPSIAALAIIGLTCGLLVACRRRDVRES